MLGGAGAVARSSFNRAGSVQFHGARGSAGVVAGRNIMPDRLREQGVNTVTLRRTLLASTAGVGLLATAMAVPAQAVSIQDFFNSDKGFSSDVRQGAERLALATEAYRSLRIGQVDRAACIDEELIPKSATDASGFDGLQADLLLAKDKTQSAEGYILKAVDISCPDNNNVAQISASAPKAEFQPTPRQEILYRLS